MKGPNRLRWIDDELAGLEQRRLRRRLLVREGPQSSLIRVAGKSFANFASNDYLALAGHERLAAAARAAIDESGWGAGASPLILGRSAAHERLEQRLAEFEGAEAALVFPSGYAANVGTICSLVSRGDAVFSDELNHASIIDGCRLSRAEVCVFPHRDCRGLKRQLDSAGSFRRKLVVTDSLFSMHGALAPLEELADLCERFEAMLMIDEAHATGVFGPTGRGVAELQGVADGIDVRVGTLSKALGCSGGFVAGSRSLISWLLNRARPYVFSTAAPAANCAAALAALDIVQQEPQRRQAVLRRAEQARDSLREQGWNVGQSESQIIPIIVGEAERALSLSTALREQGFWVPAIRPPSVPAGAACLRLSMCYRPDDAEGLERLLETMKGLR